MREISYSEAIREAMGERRGRGLMEPITLTIPNSDTIITIDSHTSPEAGRVYSAHIRWEWWEDGKEMQTQLATYGLSLRETLRELAYEIKKAT